MPTAAAQTDAKLPSPRHSFYRAVLSGIGVVLPPLLTVVIFLWVGRTIQVYLLKPIKDGSREALVWSLADVRERPPEINPRERRVVIDEREYIRLDNGQYVPAHVMEYVEERVRDSGGAERLPSTGQDVYRRYVEARYLGAPIVIPVFLCCFILLLYLLGKFLAAGIGAIFWGLFERGILRLPVVRSVYSSVKQVTNFLFSGGEIQFNRVVAVEYPRPGIWTVGLVTGEGVRDIRAAANEPIVAVMLPCSPMPVTGYAVMVPASRTVDLDMTIDQALQFIVSCGVVVPRKLPPVPPAPAALPIEGPAAAGLASGERV